MFQCSGGALFPGEVRVGGGSDSWGGADSEPGSWMPPMMGAGPCHTRTAFSPVTQGPREPWALERSSIKGAITGGWDYPLLGQTSIQVVGDDMLLRARAACPPSCPCPVILCCVL